MERLPAELLSHIYSLLPDPRSVRELSLSNKQMHDFVKKEGWKVFTETHFPSMVGDIPQDVDYSQVARDLSDLSRSWDRRALTAFEVAPHSRDPCLGRKADRPGVTNGTTHRGARLMGQTMGFQPMIDSQEEIRGGEWTRRTEFLVWGAGSSIGFRLRNIGTGSFYQESEDLVDEYGSASQFNYHVPVGAIDGRDDITDLKLFSRSHVVQRYNDRVAEGDYSIRALVGTAAGNLNIHDITMPEGRGHERDQKILPLITQSTTLNVPEPKPSIRSVTIAPSQKVCVAGSNDSTITLFRTDTTESSVSPETTMNINPKYDNIWSTCFLSDECLAIGTGPSSSPMQTYQITPTGIEPTPTRVWLSDGSLYDSKLDIKRSKGRVSCIQPLPSAFRCGGSPGQLFLTGNLDGSIRLHDMRSNSGTEQSFSDPIEQSAVYSMLTKGREGIVAGNASHSMIKFFDLRMSGGRVYSYQATKPSSNGAAQSSTEDDVWTTFMQRGPRGGVARSSTGDNGWTTFIKRVPSPHAQSWRRGRGGGQAHFQRAHHLRPDSSIYSLSSPSQFSPSIYAGLEATICQINLQDLFETFQAPATTSTVFFSPDIPNAWAANPGYTPMTLAYYEHSAPNNLMKQLPYPQDSKVANVMLEKKQAQLDYQTGPGSVDRRWTRST